MVCQYGVTVRSLCVFIRISKTRGQLVRSFRNITWPVFLHLGLKSGIVWVERHLERLYEVPLEVQTSHLFNSSNHFQWVFVPFLFAWIDFLSLFLQDLITFPDTLLHRLFTFASLHLVKLICRPVVLDHPHPFDRTRLLGYQLIQIYQVLLAVYCLLLRLFPYYSPIYLR